MQLGNNEHILEVGEEPCTPLYSHHHAVKFTEETVPGLAGYPLLGVGLRKNDVEPQSMICRELDGAFACIDVPAKNGLHGGPDSLPFA